MSCAELPKRPHQIGLAPAALVDLDATALRRERLIELAEPREANAGIIQRERISARGLEIRPCQNRFELLERIVITTPNQPAHAEVVDGEGFAILVGSASRLFG